MRLAARQRTQLGFSMVELMVSLGMLAIISVYLTDMLIRQSRAYEVVDQVTEVQQNARVIADLLDREIRETGFMAPEGAAFCGYDAPVAPDTDTDMFFVTDRAALTMRDGVSIEFDQAALVQGASSWSGTNTGTRTVVVDNVILDNRPAYDLSTPLDGVNDADFQIGGGVIGFDYANSGRGTACGIITAINGNTLTVNFSPNGFNSQLQGPAPVDEDLRVVPANYYWVRPPAGAQASPQLVRNQTLLAEDVEDLQFAVFLDFDGDSLIDLPANEHPGAGGIQPVYQAQGTDHTQIREIRVSFVLRGRYPDPELGRAGLPGGRFQTTENRVFAGANDQFRRRVHTAAIRPRNVGARAGAGT